MTQMRSTFSVTLERCPVCKKARPLADGAANCPRCGCDLTKSVAAHTAAHHYTMAAAASLRAGDSADALENAAYAWTLAQLPTIPPIACIAALHSRQLTELALWRSRLTE